MVILEHIRHQFFGNHRHTGAFVSGVSRSYSFPAILLSLFFLVFSQAAFAERLDVLLDLDNNPTTGCTLVTPDGPFGGVEQVLRTGYDADQVTGIELLSCLDPATNTLSAPVMVSPGGWPIGSGLGTDGGDVVETAVAFRQLGSPSSTLRLGFATLDRLMLPADALLTNSGADILLSLPGGPATPVPTLQELGIALLSLLLAAAAFHGYRRNPHVGKSLFTIVIIVGGIGLVWAAIMPDGDPSDWGSATPIAEDGIGESSSGDLDACFGELTTDAMSIRCDMRPFVNTAPSFDAVTDQAVLEDAAAQTVAGWATGMDDGDGGTQALVFDITANSNPALFEAGPAVAADGTLAYTPATDANGSASITLVLQDDGGTGNGGEDTSAPQIFTINVTGVNDAPSFTKGADQTVADNAGAQTVTGWATAIVAGPANEAGQTLTFNVTGNTNAALFTVGPAVAADGTLSYTPMTGVTGSATITLVLQDDGGTANGGVDTTAPQSFLINVVSVNSAPSFTKGADETVLEDAGAQSVAGWATAVDDGDGGTQVLSFNITGNTNAALFSAGPAVAADGTLTYTPAADANGSATITLVLQDDGGTANGGVDTSAPQSFAIDVTQVNDAPSFVKGADQTVLEDAGSQTVAGWATGISAGPADESGQTLAFNVTNNTNAALFSATPAVAADGTLTYTPAAGVSGNASITLELQDDGGTANGGADTTAPQSFVINVTSVNSAPSFTKGADETVLEDAGAQTVANWATAIDDGDGGTQTLAFNITGNTNAALFSAGPAVAADGTLTYTPAANANGSASITLVLQDDGGTANGGVDTSLPQSFVIDLTAVNDPPQVTGAPGPFSATGNVGISVPQAAGLLDSVTVTDADGAAAEPFQVSDGPAAGDLSIATAGGGMVTIKDASAGTFDYSPPAGFAGADSFTYVVCDSGVPAPAECSGAVTVNLNVSDRIWFIDSNAAGAGGNGTLSDPFRTLNEFQLANGLGAGSPAVNDCVYLEGAAAAYTGPVTLLDGQILVGEGASASIEGVCGITLATYSSALPATGGVNPQITSAGNGINLASGNTLRGVSVGDTTGGTGITGSAGGTLTVSEVSVTGAGTGIDVTNGTLAVILDEVSSSDDSGIVLDNVAGSLAVVTGTIGSGANTAVDITGTPLALNVTLASVSSVGGTAVAISLDNTTGGFSVSGGSISGKTGADGSTTSGIGVYLSNAEGVSLSNMQLNDFSNFAIRGTDVTDFSLVNTTVDGSNGSSAAQDEGSISFDNLLGSASFTDNDISGGFEDNIVVTNNTGTLDRMTVSGGTIGLNATATGNDGILVESQASATLNLTVSGVTFEGARGDMVQCNALGTSTMDCVLEDNTFENTHTNIVSGGGGVTVAGGGAGSNITQTYDISGTSPGAQSFAGAEGNSITLNYVSGAGSATGTIMNNQVGQSGIPGSGSIDGSGILVGASENLVHTATVDSNTVLGVTGSLSGIELVANTDVAFNATVIDNSVSEMGGFSLAAMYTLFGGAGTETGTACLDIRSNVLDASAATTAGGSAVFMDQISALGNYNLPGYAGSPNGESGTFCGAGTASTDIATYQAGRGNTLTDGPIVSPPGVNAPFVCGVTGVGTTCP